MIKYMKLKEYIEFLYLKQTGFTYIFLTKSFQIKNINY